MIKSRAVFSLLVVFIRKAGEKEVLTPAGVDFLFYYALHTVPVTPEKAELTFLADGILLPEENADDKQYLKECRRSNVRPYTKEFLNHTYCGLRFDFNKTRDYLEQVRESSHGEALVAAAITGGRTHAIELVFAPRECSREYALFYGDSFARVHDAGYRVTEGKLYFGEAARYSFYPSVYFYHSASTAEFKGNELNSVKGEQGIQLRSWLFRLSQHVAKNNFAAK